MNREIKYRARVTKADGSQEWQYFTLGDLVCGTTVFLSNTYKVEFSNWCEFTGLTDRNGVEIYEGDIIELSGGGEKPERGEVIFEYGCFCFKAAWINKGKHYPELKYYTEVHFVDCEVIGNVFENPELMEG